ncbi:hypothetical protein [Streptomyces sp. NPDC058985]|uniref:hypothetical protein n=1 Tax=Streptomyces sp. NPDC058985 TaxID=3346684 RepID=UPI00367C3DA1
MSDRMSQKSASSARLTTPDRAALRAEQRRLREAIRAKRSLLKGRAAFEKAEERRRFIASVSRDKANRTYQAALATADRDKQQKQQTVAHQLRALDSDQQNSEAKELRLLREQFIDKTLRRAHLSVKELNGLGTGLINDLAARGVRTAADFTGVSRGAAPNGKGGKVMWIIMASGHRVHVNGIGEHRAKVLVEWRRSCVRRAEDRAPKRITLADRQRIEEAAKRRRAELETRKATAESVADEARTEAKGALDAALARLAEADRDAERAAAAKRAQYDVIAKELARLEEQLEASYATHGAPLFRGRSGNRGVRPTPPTPARTNKSPVQKPPRHAPRPQAPVGLFTPKPVSVAKPEASPVRAGTKRPGLRWLIPVGFYLLSALTCTPVLIGAPPWVSTLLGLGHVAVSAYIYGHWIRRRRQWKNEGTTTRMPKSALNVIWAWLIVAAITATSYT